MGTLFANSPRPLVSMRRSTNCPKHLPTLQEHSPISWLSNQHSSSRRPCLPLDVIFKTWKRMYSDKGWNRIAPYKKTGDFNRPYILFKAKNITQIDVRKKKWDKTRPIAPQTKHPMGKLFHLTGRAWSFITAPSMTAQLRNFSNFTHLTTPIRCYGERVQLWVSTQDMPYGSK